jgi:hypothetical protein
MGKNAARNGPKGPQIGHGFAQARPIPSPRIGVFYEFRNRPARGFRGSFGDNGASRNKASGTRRSWRALA